MQSVTEQTPGLLFAAAPDRGLDLSLTGKQTERAVSPGLAGALVAQLAESAAALKALASSANKIGELIAAADVNAYSLS